VSLEERELADDAVASQGRVEPCKLIIVVVVVVSSAATTLSFFTRQIDFFLALDVAINAGWWRHIEVEICKAWQRLLGYMYQWLYE